MSERELVEQGRVPASRLHRRRRWREALVGYAFLLPNLLGFLAFTFLPVLAAFALSLTDWNLLSGERRFVGVDNFRTLFADRDFWQLGGSHAGYFWNTIILMLGMPVSIAGSLFLALMMNQRFRGMTFFRTLYFLPTVSSAVALALLWKWLYNADYGMINSVFHTLRLDVAVQWTAGLFGVRLDLPLEWLGQPALAKPALIMMSIWMAVGGYNCILYLAGLQNIPEELYEAAAIDGATWWTRLRHITWPLLSPTTLFILVMSTIAGFQGYFTQVLLMTDGGPGRATTTIMYYLWEVWFKDGRAGYGAAIACLLFAIIFGFTLIYFRLAQRLGAYEAQ